MTVLQLGVIALTSLGCLFMLVSALGILIMPDLYTRLQAASKASTLGAICILFAVALHFGALGVTVRAVLVVFFLLLTAPIAAHQIARAGYFSGVPMEDQAVIDDLKGRYDTSTHALSSPSQRPPETSTSPPDDDSA